MNEINRQESQEPESQLTPENLEKKDSEIERAKKSFATVFEQHKDGRERAEVVIKRLGGILDLDAFDGVKIKQSIEACSQIDDEKQFVDGVISALEPILTFRKNNPQAFEQMAREVVMNQEGMKPLNEIMYYGGHDNYVHIHLAHARDIGIGKLRSLVLDGLQKLAEVVKNNEKIEDIEATSWIVAKNPKLIEKLGFEVQGEINEEFRRQYFSEDERDIAMATIKREEFLKRYLKEEK
ncbi:MAG: hypothetical protein AAB361_02400 [Patescibacteria group bacterium]